MIASINNRDHSEHSRTGATPRLANTAFLPPYHQRCFFEKLRVAGRPRSFSSGFGCPWGRWAAALNRLHGKKTDGSTSRPVRRLFQLPRARSRGGGRCWPGLARKRSEGLSWLMVSAARASVAASAGGGQGVIASKAEALFERFTPTEQGMVRREFLKLVKPGEGGDLMLVPQLLLGNQQTSKEESRGLGTRKHGTSKLPR